jgi:hypothetical protein
MTYWPNFRPENIPLENIELGLLLLGGIGLIYCFLGYPIMRFMLGLTGFLIAGGMAAFLGAWLSQGNHWVTVFALIIGGACGATALWFLYRVGIFLVGLTASVLIAYEILHTRPEAWATWAILGIGIAGGMLSLFLQRPIISVATAAIGSWLVTYVGAYFILGDAFADEIAASEQVEGNAWWVLLAWLLLTVLGTSFQFLIGGKRKKQADAG